MKKYLLENISLNIIYNNKLFFNNCFSIFFNIFPLYLSNSEINLKIRKDKLSHSYQGHLILDRLIFFIKLHEESICIVH